MNSIALNSTGLVLHSERPQKVLGDAYLKFQLDSKTAAVLLMKQVQEVHILPTNRLTPIPNMPACVMGLMSRRSRVLWVIDLAQMLKIQPLNALTQQYNVVILQPGVVSIGALVHRIDGMTWLQPEQIQPPPNHFPPGLVTHLKGCVLQEKEILLVLDAEAVMRSPLLHQP
ncbi:chemotaxis protein CheW [Kovacikia minuta CCNUW1]|uniref:chemotaxis protein CheW n=1 Tax=Kovacikia minuta TaxID=2931930 RepID=UPI001CCD85DA|nr:chemotaxis protein CheW [Kovacikia minuta]UBF24711.1 chemotaxis protein CheW [Kovacikia minuta CCNUW1]